MEHDAGLALRLDNAIKAMKSASQTIEESGKAAAAASKSTASKKKKIETKEASITKKEAAGGKGAKVESKTVNGKGDETKAA